MYDFFRANIKNGEFSKGEELIEYVQPFPMNGTGWHRCAFILFEHSKPLKQDFSTGSQFEKRSFKTSSFYLQNQDNFTPVGLSFFQTEWDLSSREIFHNYFGKIN